MFFSGVGVCGSKTVVSPEGLGLIRVCYGFWFCSRCSIAFAASSLIGGSPSNFWVNWVFPFSGPAPSFIGIVYIPRSLFISVW